MGEFSPPLFSEPLSFFLLMHRPQTPQPGFDSITLLQKFTPHFKILDLRLKPHACIEKENHATLVSWSTWLVAWIAGTCAQQC